MQAVVLTAGYGRRMRPLSDYRHKALLSIGGTTILGRIMDALVATGTQDVTVVTGYRAEEVREFLLGSYRDTRFHFVHNERYETTNNIVSLSMAFQEMDFEEDVLLLECDLLFDPLVLQRLVDHPAGNVALVDRYCTGMDGTVVSVVDGAVGQVFTPSSQGVDFDYSDKYKTLNIYRFDKEFCRSTLKPLIKTYANEIDSSSYYELVVGMLVNLPQYRVAAEIVRGDRWVEVDDPNDLAVARFRFEPEARPSVLDRNLGGHWNFDFLDFAFMRNAYFPTPSMLAAMRHALPQLVSSYSSSQLVLNEKMGFFLHCQPDRLQVLHGASQAYPFLKDSFSSARVAIPAPTFGEYSRAFPHATTYPDAPGVDWDHVEKLLADLDLLVVVNPNTPAGTTAQTAKLLDFARRHPDTTFLVDESFLAFSGQPSVLPFLEAEPLENVVVLTSLSKALGVPGLRLGYLYSTRSELVAELGHYLPIWNLSSPAEFLLELVLKSDGQLKASIEQTIADREALRARLAEVPLIDHVHDSGGNYLLACLDKVACVTVRALRANLLTRFRIDVKDVSGRYNDEAPRMRVGVRTPQENARLVAALTELSLV